MPAATKITISFTPFVFLCIVRMQYLHDVLALNSRVCLSAVRSAVRRQLCGFMVTSAHKELVYVKYCDYCAALVHSCSVRHNRQT